MEVFRPCFDFVFSDAWLCNMVDDKELIWMAVDQGDRLRKMLSEDEQIAAQPMAFSYPSRDEIEFSASCADGSVALTGLA
jgi:hypothetical protein